MGPGFYEVEYNLAHYILKTSPYPTTEPLTLAEVKVHLKIESDVTAEDTLLAALIATAREQTEIITRRALISQTWTAYLDEFPCRREEIELPYPPLTAVNSIKYYDVNGTLETLSSATYQVSTVKTPGEIELVCGEVWPVVQQEKQDAVAIEFVAGYANAAAVPNSIKQAMLLMIGHWYENKGDTIVGTIATTIPNTSEILLFPFRDLRF